MPLLDHFRPPWSVRRPWDGLYGAWATAVAFHLNNGDVLPAGYFAMPLLQGGGFETQVLRNFGGPQLRAAIELVSPSNKDRPASRRAFADKCAGYLRRGASVIVIDIVTERQANLHAEILQSLERPEGPRWESPTHLYAVAYHSVLTAGRPRLEMWPHVLTVGAPLLELPMWLEIDLCVPLQLEESYTVTCGSLRMRG